MGGRNSRLRIADFDQFSMQKLVDLARAKASKRIQSLSRWSALVRRSARIRASGEASRGCLQRSNAQALFLEQKLPKVMAKQI